MIDSSDFVKSWKAQHWDSADDGLHLLLQELGAAFQVNIEIVDRGRLTATGNSVSEECSRCIGGDVPKHGHTQVLEQARRHASIKEIADSCLLSEERVSSIFDELVQAGLIPERNDGNDETK